MITQLITIDKANEIHSHYSNFNSSFLQEQFLLSNFGKKLLHDLKVSLVQQSNNKAEVLLVAITSWIKKDVNYYKKLNFLYNTHFTELFNSFFDAFLCINFN